MLNTLKARVRYIRTLKLV